MTNTAGGGRYKNRNSLTVAPTPQNETTTTELAQQKAEMQKIIEKGGIRNDLMRKRLDRMSSRVSEMGKRVKSIEETGRFLVKVADSCPLAFEQQRLQQLQKPHSQQETEAIRLQKMKKQAFLEKISRELKDK